MGFTGQGREDDPRPGRGFLKAQPRPAEDVGDALRCEMLVGDIDVALFPGRTDHFETGDDPRLEVGEGILL